MSIGARSIIDDTGTLIAIHIETTSDLGSGINFLTEGESELQVGVFKHPSNHLIRRHWHPPFVRELSRTCEVLYLETGRIEVELFNNSLVPIETFTLNPGGILVLLSGGHGFKTLEPSTLIEVKQGPYAGNKDKELF